MKPGDDKKWALKPEKKDDTEFFDDQLGENASEEWGSDAYSNAKPGKNLKTNRPNM